MAWFGFSAGLSLVCWLLGARAAFTIGPHFGSIDVVTVLVCAAIAGVVAFGIGKGRKAIASDRKQAYISDLSSASETFTYIVDLDRKTVIQCNQFLCDFIGYSQGQITAGGLKLMRRLTHPDDWRTTLQHFADIAHYADGDVLEFEQRLLSAQGEWRWILFRESVLERHGDGSARLTRGTGQDITERKEVENALRQGHELLECIIDSAAVGMAMLTIDGRFLRVNSALCDFLGYQAWDLMESDFQSVTHADDLESDLRQLAGLIDGSHTSYSMEKRYVRRDGAVVWGNLSVALMRSGLGQPMYLIGQVLDITERKTHEAIVVEYAALLEKQAAELDAANRRLEHQAAMDALTGLFNRRMLDTRLHDAVELAKQFESPLSVILFDVDHFKHFNDIHGHVAGDEALKAVANVVRSSVRPSDVVARFGGEEFAVICIDTSLEQAIFLAEHLRYSVSSFMVGAQAVTCSFGVAAFSEAFSSPASLIQAADGALYEAKATGRNRVCAANSDNSRLNDRVA